MLSVLLSGGAAREPAFWVLLASVAAGVAISAATRRVGPPRRTTDVDGAWRGRTWTTVTLALSGVVAAWLLAVFVPGPARVADTKYLYYFLVCSALLSVAFRFPRSAGAVLFVALVSAGAGSAVLTRAVRPYAGEVEIARAVVYSRRADVLDVELRSPGNQTAHVRLQGELVVPLVSTLEFDDLWPFLGWRGWYRLEGASGGQAAGGPGQESIELVGEPFRYTALDGLSGALYRWVQEHATELPGVSVSSAEDVGASVSESVRAAVEELTSYVFRLSADGRVSRIESVGQTGTDR